MKVLLLIDIQNDFLPGGALPVPAGDAIIPVVSRLTGSFPLVVATQDWHPRGHGSFASSHAGKRPFDTVTYGAERQTLWPDHCVQGTPGAAFPVSLDTRPVEAIFRKGTDPLIDSYSAFYDKDHRKTTGLAGYLRDKQVTDVYLAGLAADICVFETAKDSLREGFNTYFVQDATRPLEAERLPGLLRQFRDQGGTVLQCGDLL
ncbi:MAG TPA: bifunctional nicotinamidase/pyrazinamidase [Puia sp.]|nr:bifunctional nicotinamidase/pyrazinamidase [Puia sp.]